MNGYEKEVKKILKKYGWKFIRAAKGSHEYWGKDGCKAVTVPHNCKSKFTANAIMKEAGINYKF
ncbi:MAG: type II toxin-antitoxin system HicA family toxin [Candidatus Parabeggiatoa sp. nov. 1]|nr:MAG: type II toxin-antitoxin system HicA family toxin [Gammaproteobacteria bacterium]